MRLAVRLLAEVKAGGGRYLEAGAPTGITGLSTHPSPRSTLLYLYGATLDKLKQFPDHSVYRQSTEALTKQRQSIIESIRPAGWEEWAEQAQRKIEEYPDAFRGPERKLSYAAAGGRTFVQPMRTEQPDEEREWDGESGGATLEGTRSPSEGAFNARMALRKDPKMQETVTWEPEPPLSVEQIDEAEQKIGAGLIEEVVEVAEGELKLVDTLLESKVWEELEEKPPPGQWDYFSRDQHVPTTQHTPSK